MFRFRLFEPGRRLAHLLHEASHPDDDVPTARDLIYRTRAVRGTQTRHHVAGPATGTTPSLDVRLRRLDVTGWWGPPLRLWRVETAITLLAGVYPVTLAESRSFGHEAAAQRWFHHVCGLRDQITDPPEDSWTNPAPWRANPVPVGAATAWWQPADPGDLSDLFWLNVFGVEVMLRRRTDGVYVHLDPTAADPVHGPLVVEVNGAGAHTYGTDHRDDHSFGG